jgi:hypothetical protein
MDIRVNTDFFGGGGVVVDFSAFGPSATPLPVLSKATTLLLIFLVTLASGRKLAMHAKNRY